MCTYTPKGAGKEGSINYTDLDEYLIYERCMYLKQADGIKDTIILLSCVVYIMSIIHSVFEP